MAPLNGLSNVEIVNIHQSNMKDTLAKDIYDGLNKQNGEQKTLPTLLLYNTEGLRLFEKITYLDEYYPTNAEIGVLTENAAKIVERIPEDAHLVELGSGNLRKVEILLNEFERAKMHVEYSALDLQLDELHRTFAELPSKSWTYVKCRGLHGTYDDALTWLTRPENRQKPLCILSMGSSVGNFTRSEAADFLKGFAEILRPSDSMIIGIDSCKVPKRVFKAYNDSQGVTRDFYFNGLVYANHVLGFDAFKAEEWDVIGLYDETKGCHEAYYVPTKDVNIEGISLRKGEKIFFEHSFKYSPQECGELWRKAGLTPTAKFGSGTNDYYLHLLSPSALSLPTKATEYAQGPVPSLKEFESLWKAWDEVTMSMVPKEELMGKPIKLRNALIFYLGHIPTFIDIHLTRATSGQPTEPRHYPLIFERGVDPDVDNPESCHAHSDIPDEWPPLDEILAFQGAVRDRVKSLLGDATFKHDRRVGEALWIGFEHEAMHLETFLYMLLQSNNVLPPCRSDMPDFESLAAQSGRRSIPNEWFTIPEQQVSVGLNDSSDGILPGQSFGWDNEKPQRIVKVSTFVAQARPITNGEYGEYLEAANKNGIPASWIPSKTSHPGHTIPIANGHTNGVSHSVNGHDHKKYGPSQRFLSKYSVRTVYGEVALRWALHWPVIASYEELQGYASWKGCRIPSFEEVRSIYLHSANLKSNERNGVKSSENGDINLINGANGVNGIEGTYNNDGGGSEKRFAKPRTPDHQPVKFGPLAQMPVYIDLDGCNVGFKHWHPTPVTQNGDKLSGQGELGGIWEWASSPLKPHEGFQAMDLYPGYTADFFDGKHNVVLGGSWATHPRIAGRTTFVNWYQRNYPYAWAGARLVRSI